MFDLKFLDLIFLKFIRAVNGNFPAVALDLRRIVGSLSRRNDNVVPLHRERKPRRSGSDGVFRINVAAASICGQSGERLSRFALHALGGVLGGQTARGLLDEGTLVRKSEPA